MDIVILAGGLGRRFGRVKQFAPVTPDGRTLLEVTIADAVSAGCRRAVVVTAPGSEADVARLLSDRLPDPCGLVVVPQRPDDLPAPVAVRRERPWGTAHAVWAARQAVAGPFLLFNADDHYGPGAPAALMAALADADGFAMLGYPLGATLSSSGTVSRAVCVVDDRGRLASLREYPAIDGRGQVAAGPDTGRPLPLDALVSMNAWAFTPAVFPILEAALGRFLATADLERDECYLPAAIDAAVAAGAATVRVVAARDRWCGLTWPEDHARVVRHLADLDAARAAAAAFGLDARGAPPAPWGDGLINATWRVDASDGAWLLQRLNAGVFADPTAIVANAAAAATRIDHALASLGDHDPRHRLSYLPGPDGPPWWRDKAGGVWRAMPAIAGSRPADPARPAERRAAARALGRFPGLVAAGQGPPLALTLPGFHDTAARLAALVAAADADAAHRLDGCRHLCDRLLALAPLAHRLPDHLPTRPVHNDAKPDNVLVDAASGEALCVVDLDTVMPGVAAHDFGDLVRGAVTGLPEDHPDLDRITIQEQVFVDLATGYLDGARGWITAAERDALVDGALVITYEQALRFLADHLAGDPYYRVDDADHNRRRAAAQLRLLEELLGVEDSLRRLVGTL